MRLIDLNPRWFVLEEGGQILGLSFKCPHCHALNPSSERERLGIVFHHQGREALEDQYILARAPDTKHIWTITGTTFEELTLTPSIDASHLGHWHGFITNGDIR